MAKAQKILSRKKAISSIHSVTRTMEMVATARFKRAYNRCLSAGGYINGMGELVGDIVGRAGRVVLIHPLLQPGKSSAPLVLLVITSDRGLCGGYNQAVLKLAKNRLDDMERESRGVLLHVAGKRGIAQLRHGEHELAETYSELDGSAGGWHDLSRLADLFTEEFLAGDIGGVEIVYSQLIGSARCRPTVLALLPMALDTPDEDEKPRETSAEPEPYECVPSVDIMLERLLPMTARLRLFRCFMEAAVTEQIARMGAMRSAGENAEEIIHALTIKYNRTRQSQITTELAEIIGGRAGLE